MEEADRPADLAREPHRDAEPGSHSRPEEEPVPLRGGRELGGDIVNYLVVEQPPLPLRSRSARTTRRAAGCRIRPHGRSSETIARATSSSVRTKRSCGRTACTHPRCGRTPRGHRATPRACPEERLRADRCAGAAAGPRPRSASARPPCRGALRSAATHSGASRRTRGECGSTARLRRVKAAPVRNGSQSADRTPTRGSPSPAGTTDPARPAHHRSGGSAPRGRSRGDQALSGTGSEHFASPSSHGTVVAWMTARSPSRIRTTPMLSKGISSRTEVATRSKTCWSSRVSEAVSAISERTRATTPGSISRDCTAPGPAGSRPTRPGPVPLGPPRAPAAPASVGGAGLAGHDQPLARPNVAARQFDEVHPARDRSPAPSRPSHLTACAPFARTPFTSSVTTRPSRHGCGARHGPERRRRTGSRPRRSDWDSWDRGGPLPLWKRAPDPGHGGGALDPGGEEPARPTEEAELERNLPAGIDRPGTITATIRWSTWLSPTSTNAPVRITRCTWPARSVMKSA